MAAGDLPPGALNKTTQLIAICAALAAIIGSWFWVKADASAARDGTVETRDDLKALRAQVLEDQRVTANALATVNLRLERIQTILERIDKDFPIRVKSEVREALKEK